MGEDGGRVCGGCVGEEENEGKETGPATRSKIPDGCRESDSRFIGVCFGGAASGVKGAGICGKKTQ